MLYVCFVVQHGRMALAEYCVNQSIIVNVPLTSSANLKYVIFSTPKSVLLVYIRFSGCKHNKDDTMALKKHLMVIKKHLKAKRLHFLS